MTDDETAAMRARFDAWREKFNGAIVYEFEFTAYADFATAEVARALAEERAKVAGNKCHVEYKPDEITFLCCLPKGHRFDHANMFKQWSLTAEEQEALPCLCTGAVSLKNCPRHRPRRQQRLDASISPLASTGMASAGPPVCKDWCGDKYVPEDDDKHGGYCLTVNYHCFCSDACADGKRSLHPAPNLSPGLKSDAEFRAAVVADARAADEPPSNLRWKCPQCRSEMFGQYAGATVCPVCERPRFPTEEVPPADRAALMADTVDARRK